MAERTTIDESKFNEDLGQIIKRDYYPDLDDLKTKQEYFDALERNDIATLRQIQMKMQSAESSTKNSADTPSTFETPDPGGKRLRNGDGSVELSNPEPPTKRLSSDLHLDQFLDKFNSEDDVALAHLMEESERQRRLRRPWLYHSSEEEQLKNEQLLALPEPSAQAAALDDKQANRDLVTWNHQAQSTIMFIPEGAPLSEKEKLEENARKPRKVIYENTRFKVSTTIGANRPGTSGSVFANRLEGKIGIDGREAITHNTPSVGGYKYVATPSPAPGNMGESPFMTWGQIESTPVLVDPSATPVTAPAFKIPDVPEREQLAIGLAEKASRHNRAKKQTALKTAADSVRRYASPSQRIASMSPAAQKLFVNRISTGQSSGAYTPSPLSSLARTPKTPSVLTPSSIVKPKDKAGTPQRIVPTSAKRAEDFF